MRRSRSRWSGSRVTEAMLAPFALVTIGTMLFHTRALESMMLGEEKARSQGVSVESAHMGSWSLPGCVRGLRGPIAFVGLIVPICPQVVRRLTPSSLPMSALMGAPFLFYAIPSRERV